MYNHISAIYLFQDELNPVQNALETMESTNKQLRALIARYNVDPNMSINPLSMKLGGIIDAAVMGGVSNYEKVGKLPEGGREGIRSCCATVESSQVNFAYLRLILLVT